MSPNANSERHRVVRRIANLLRIAQYDDGPQGRTARAMAKKLMQKHNIEVVLEAEDAKRDQPSVEHRALETELDIVPWKVVLLNDLAPLYGCASLSTRGIDGRLWLLWLVGAPAQVQRCAIHYEWICGEIRRAVMNKTRKRIFTKPDPVWDQGVACGALENLVRRLRGRDFKPVDFGFEIQVGSVPIEKALVPTNVPERVEVEPPVEGPEVRAHLPPIDLDPPQAALRAGYEYAEKRCSPQPPAAAYGAIDVLELPNPIPKLLREHQISRVYDLMLLRPKQLRALPRIGLRRYLQIASALAAMGLSMRPDW